MLACSSQLNPQSGSIWMQADSLMRRLYLVTSSCTSLLCCALCEVLKELLYSLKLLGQYANFVPEIGFSQCQHGVINVANAGHAKRMPTASAQQSPEELEETMGSWSQQDRNKKQLRRVRKRASGTHQQEGNNIGLEPPQHSWQMSYVCW